MTDARRQVQEVLSGVFMANGGQSIANGIWHVDAYVTNTTGATLTAVTFSAIGGTATATVTSLLSVPGTNAATTVASVIVHYVIPVTFATVYTLAGTGIVIVGGGGVILPA